MKGNGTNLRFWAKPQIWAKQSPLIQLQNIASDWSVLFCAPGPNISETETESSIHFLLVSLFFRSCDCFWSTTDYEYGRRKVHQSREFSVNSRWIDPVMLMPRGTGQTLSGEPVTRLAYSLHLVTIQSSLEDYRVCFSPQNTNQIIKFQKLFVSAQCFTHISEKTR